jgi:hypothetical protein
MYLSLSNQFNAGTVKSFPWESILRILIPVTGGLSSRNITVTNFAVIAYTNPQYSRAILGQLISQRKNEMATIQIVDATGRKMKEEKITLNGNASVSIDINNLKKGTYILLLRSKNYQ